MICLGERVSANATPCFSFHQPQVVCQCTTYSPTLLVSGWLAGWLLATKPAGHDWPRLSSKKISSFTNKKASPSEPSHPPPPAPAPLGIKPGGPASYQLVARHQGCLPQPSFVETPLAFQAQGSHSLEKSLNFVVILEKSWITKNP